MSQSGSRITPNSRFESRPRFLGTTRAISESIKALLFPIDWPEPFGLVMSEAMACGTPVIAFRRGSVPEIIEDGISGFVVDSEEHAFEGIKRLPELDRRRVREAFDRSFAAQRMTRDYVTLHERLCASSR